MRLADVAKAAGVGYGTASRAVSGRGYIDEGTRERVLAAAEQLGYRPDAAARALRERRTRTIGLIVPDIVNEFYTASAEVLQNRLARSGFQLLVATTANDADQDRAAIASMLDRQVEGIVHVPVTSRAGAPLPVPVIELNRSTGACGVISDDVAGVSLLTALLADQGVERIAAITGPPQLSSSRDRARGFVQELKRRGFSPDPAATRHWSLKEVPYTPDGGREAMAELLHESPQAVIALSSRIAVGALGVLQERGVRIPQDVAFAAYGDPEWYAVFPPGITAFAPPLAQMGLRAAELLLARIEDPATDWASVERMAGSLRVRQSHRRPEALRARLEPRG